MSRGRGRGDSYDYSDSEPSVGYGERPRSRSRRRDEPDHQEMQQMETAESIMQDMLLESRPSQPPSLPPARTAGFTGALTEAQHDALRVRYHAAEALARGQPMDLPQVNKGFGKGTIPPTDLDINVASEPKVDPVLMDFSKVNKDMPTSHVDVQKTLVPKLMTLEHKKLLADESGANVYWQPEDAKVLLSGSVEQIQRAEKLLARVTVHCRWGCTMPKIRQLLKPIQVESVLVRLSPMDKLKPAKKMLTANHPLLSIGKETGNDMVIVDSVMSRRHCMLQLQEDRGVYIIDCSTNGTFLNGVRLPGKEHGKVLLSHGDELLFKDPAGEQKEFGYIINLEVIHAKREALLEAPRRLLTADEIGGRRDFG